MRAGDLSVQFILKMVDQFSGPAKQASAQFAQFSKKSKEYSERGVAWSNTQLEANRQRMDGLRDEAIGLAALGTSLYALTEPAIQAERQLAEVSKVVSFSAEDGFALLQKDIRNLVTDGGLAMTAQGLTEIVEQAGRMGVVDENLPDAQKRQKLLDFATAAGKMAVAFGISADEAGMTLGRWRENLSLSQQEALILGDTVNLLGNTMATNEADILQVINRQGVVAKTAGLATHEIAALSATLLASGAAPEVAATGLKNFTNALTRGESVTKRQSDVFKALGLNAKDVAVAMQDDASGAILTVLEAFKDIEPYRRNSLIGDLFGEEAKGAITPLVENTQLLKDTLGKTVDTAALLGLMEEEYQRQSQTTFAQRQRLFEYMKGLSVVIGTSVLPALNTLMASIMPVIHSMTAWAEAHPELMEMMIKGVAGLVALKAASIAVRFAFFGLLGPVFKLVRAGAWLVRVFGLIGPALRMIKPLKWAGLIPRLMWRRIVTPIKWLALAGSLLWGKLISPLKWAKTLIPKISWGKAAGALRWSRLLKPLSWALKFGGRALIGPIGWALLAGELLWDLLLSKLPWSDWIGDIDWKNWFDFEWADLLPNWSWDAIIPSFSSSSVPAPAATGGSGYLPPSMRDGGGPVRKGMPYIVGERAPELFVPQGSGHIIPNRGLNLSKPSQSRPQSGGNITINITAPQGGDPAQIARAVAREIEKIKTRGRASLHDGRAYT